MNQTEAIDLVFQTLRDRLQSPYAPQREASQAAIEALETIKPFIFPDLSMVPKGFAFEGLYYGERIKKWYCVFSGPKTSPLSKVCDYGTSPRDAFDAVVEKIKREGGRRK